MYKYLTPATAIALALGLQGCGTTSTFPKVNLEGVFSGQNSDSRYNQDMGKMQGQMSLAEASISAGDPASGIRIYRELARQYPLSLLPRIKLGEALLAANAPQEAARAFAGANGIKPSYEGLIGLGRVHLALRDPAGALEQFDAAAKLRPDDSIVMNGRAVALDQLGRHDEAQKTYLALLEKEPSNLKVRNNYALSLALAGKYDDATDILTSLAQVPDSEERIRQNLALVYGLQGNDGQAAHVGRMDLDEDAVNNNLKYYQTLRNLDSPGAKGAALTQPPSLPFESNNAPLGGHNVEASSVRSNVEAQSAPRRVRNAKGIASLPMTRAEAARQAPSGNTAATAPRTESQSRVVETVSDDRIFDPPSQTVNAKAKSKPAAKSKRSSAQVAVASPKAASAKSATTDKSASGKARSGVRLPAVPPDAAVAATSGKTSAKAKPVREAKAGAKAPAQAKGNAKPTPLDANPIDVGVRAPAVPAVL